MYVTYLFQNSFRKPFHDTQIRPNDPGEYDVNGMVFTAADQSLIEAASGFQRGRHSRCERSRRGGVHECPRLEPIRRSLRARRAETKHECSGRFRRSRSVGLRARRAQHASRSTRQYRSRLERLPLTSYQRGIFAIIATAWFFDSMDLGALTFVLGSIKQTFQLSTAGVGLLSSLSFLGMAQPQPAFSRTASVEPRSFRPA